MIQIIEQKPSRFNIALAIVIIAIGFCALPLSDGIQVSGVISEVQAEPGEHISFEISVSCSEGEGPQNITTEIEGWQQSLEEGNLAVEKYSGPLYAGSFLDISPKSFRIDPENPQKIKVEGDVPADSAAGGRYAMISIRTAPFMGENNIANVVAINALVLIHILGEDISRSSVISNLNLEEPISIEQQNVSLILNNTGNIDIQVQANADLKDQDGNVLANTTSSLTSYILPESAKRIQLSLNPELELMPGHYNIEASVSLEDGTLLATKNIELDIPNPE
jgi:hypothetical protein